MKELFKIAFEENKKVRERKTGIIAEVINAFGDGELYLDEGTSGISPIVEYDEDDFEIVNNI